MREALVIPCYEEETRLQTSKLDALLERDTLDLVLVDDGSKDRTLAVLEAYRERNLERVRVLALRDNSGKAEAVRQGLVAAIDGGAEVVGYTDADFATSPEELVRLLDLLHARELHVVFGARVRVFGSNIRREGRRHILGRVFASLASFALGEAVYDTQCGAKWFRLTPSLRASVEPVFATDWAFDVELLARLLGKMGGPATSVDRCLEVPLHGWTDVPESKVKLSGMAKSLLDLVRVYRMRRD